MTVSRVLAIDPGGRQTGLAVRVGKNFERACVVDREDFEEIECYLPRVLEVVAEYAGSAVSLMAIEGVVAPVNAKTLGMIHTRGLLDTAVVLGAVIARWPSVVVVPPGKHGSAPLSTYPAELVGEREKVGAGWLRHARSAWDVGWAAERMGRLKAAA
jgi:hypothetical protein